MPLSHLLDTDVFSQPIRKIPDANVADRWKALGDSALAIAAITEAEVLFGLEKKGSPKLTARYEQILKGRLPILPVDSAVAASYATLRADCERRGMTVADMDLLIAATAHAHNLIVATMNVKHFDNINGITMEDWSKP